VARLPIGLVQNYQKLAASGFANLLSILGVLIVAVLAVAGVVYVTEVEPFVPVTYAKQVRGNKGLRRLLHLYPASASTKGVIPIIFAPSPSCSSRRSSLNCARPSGPHIRLIASWSQVLALLLTPPSWWYGIL